jgi:hypothetical protein
MLVQILEQVLNGLLVGAYYLLIALGLSLIFALGGLVNLAHGAFYAPGAYIAVTLADYLGFGGVLVASPVLVALIGLVVERFSSAASIAPTPRSASCSPSVWPWSRSRRCGLSRRRTGPFSIRRRSRDRCWSAISSTRAIGS